MNKPYVPLSSKSVGDALVDIPSPGSNVNWGDPAAPENEENMSRQLERSGPVEAIERRISNLKRR